jgi:peptidoglycan/xylan/chitin deacetylase (PgdA/CDA1 family)
MMSHFTEIGSYATEDAINRHEKRLAIKKRTTAQVKGFLLFLFAVFLLVFADPIICHDDTMKAESLDMNEREEAVFAEEASIEDLMYEEENAESLHNETKEARYFYRQYPLSSMSYMDLLREERHFDELPDTVFYNGENPERASMAILTAEEKDKKEDEEPDDEPAPEEIADPVTYAYPEGYRVLYNLPKSYALLTFDDGPSAYTQQIVDILNRYNVQGLFFFIGLHTQGRYEAMRYVTENGCAVGNHGYSHRDMSAMTYDEQKQEVVRTNEIIEQVTGVKPKFYRPPFGNYTEELDGILKEAEMKTVLWNKDPADWNNKTGEEIMKYITEATPYGGIYLLHETPETVAILPMIIEFLLLNGVEFITLE